MNQKLKILLQHAFNGLCDAGVNLHTARTEGCPGINFESLEAIGTDTDRALTELGRLLKRCNALPEWAQDPDAETQAKIDADIEENLPF